MEFSICRVNQSDLDELTAVEAVCFPKEEAATRESLAARLDAFGNWFCGKGRKRENHRHD